MTPQDRAVLANPLRGGHGWSRVTPEIQERIRRVVSQDPDISFTDLGKRFRISATTVSHIVKRTGPYAS